MAITRRASALPDSENAKKEKANDHLFADLDHAHRRQGCFSCRNLGCAFVLVLGLMVLGVFGVVAETGLVRVPVLSSALYQQPPRPIRPVEPAGETSVEALLMEKIQALDPATANGQVRLTVGEDELTKLVQEPRANGQVPVKQAQVTIEPTFVELYGLINMPNGEKSAVLRIRLEPNPAKTSEVRVSEIRLGYVRVPIPLATLIVRIATGYLPPETLSGEQFGVRAIELNRGTITLTVDQDTVRSLMDEDR